MHHDISQTDVSANTSVAIAAFLFSAYLVISHFNSELVTTSNQLIITDKQPRILEESGVSQIAQFRKSAFSVATPDFTPAHRQQTYWRFL